MQRMLAALRGLTCGIAVRITLVAVAAAVALGALLADAAAAMAAGALVAATVTAIVAFDLRRSNRRLTREVERSQRQVLLVDAEVDRVRDLVRALQATVDGRSLDDARQVEAFTQLLALMRPRRALPASRGWAASPDLLLGLYELVSELSPSVIVECGSGLSTIVLGYACEQAGSGRVVALEHDEAYAATSRANVARHGLSEWVEVRMAQLGPLPDGTALPSPAPAGWYDPTAWSQLDGIDLLVVDGPPEGSGVLARLPAVPLLASRMAPGAMVVLDDADRDDEREIVRRWVDEGWAVPLDAPPTEKGVAVLALADRGE